MKVKVDLKSVLKIIMEEKEIKVDEAQSEELFDEFLTEMMGMELVMKDPGESDAKKFEEKNRKKKKKRKERKKMKKRRKKRERKEKKKQN